MDPLIVHPIVCLALAGLAGMTTLQAEDPQSSSLSPSSQTTTNRSFEEIQPGVYQLEKIQLDKTRRTVTFPAVVNLTESPVEYLLVTDAGKIHESILRTQVHPYQIHLAMLLLGARGTGTNALPEDPDQPLPGDPVSVQVRWQTKDGNTLERKAEDLVINLVTQSSLPRGPWTYTGSILFQGTFLAQQEGSIISLITDSIALINNPDPDRQNDDAWRPHHKRLPPEETPVTLILHFSKPPKSKPAASKKKDV